MHVDWSLLAVFALMCIVFRSVGAWRTSASFRRRLAAQATLGRAALAEPLGLFLGGALLSQFVSNVPAAIVLAE